MARFFGRYEHAVDDKGRVILPVKFRPSFEHGGYLTQHLEGCLALWTPEEFEVEMQQMQELAGASPRARNQARVRASSSFELDIDRQGRMVIPARLRAYAALESDVLVLGVIDRVELWDPTRWEEKVGPDERRMTEGSDS